MRRIIALAAAASLVLSGCAPLAAAMGGAAPPQASATFTSISRSAIDFALNSFDAALYGLDFAMDAGKLTPGSTQARQIAAVGRRVMGFLGAADAAQHLGSSATYEAAFANAKSALDEFRALLPTHPASFQESVRRAPMTNAQRMAILARLERGGSIA